MATITTSPTGLSLQRLAEQAQERGPGAEAKLIFEGTTFTGAQLAERASRVSQGLRNAGLQPGDRVVVCMANCPEVAISYNAIWRAGAVTTPVIFLLSEDELRHVFIDSGATFAITTPEFLPKVALAALGVETMTHVVVVGDVDDSDVLRFSDLEAADEGELVDRDPTDLAALLYTGGTTGRSKGVMISHNALSASAWAATSTAYSPEQRVLLQPLPLSHVYGLMVSTMALHVPEPGTTLLMRWFDPTAWLELVQQHQVTTATVVPSMLQLLLAQPLEDYDLSSLRRVTSGGAPLPREVAEAFGKRVPNAEVTEGYGCTETAAIISTNPLGKARPGSVGLPAPGVELEIRTPDGRRAGPGEDGEVCVRGPLVMSGYWNAPEATDKALQNGWLHTGDVGHLDSDGYLYIVDRIKDLIIRGGFNVYPRDVEDAMLAHDAVVACAVVGRPDPTYGEEVVAFVQLRPDTEVTEPDLLNYAKEHIARNKYPREVHIVESIPLTSVGKTDRKALRARLLTGG